MVSFGKIVEGELKENMIKDSGQKLNDLLLEFGVICLRGEPLSPDIFLNLARKLGKPKVQLLREHRLKKYPEISIISNQHKDYLGDGKKIILGAFWHTDDSYLDCPSAITLLHANIIPGRGLGGTEFADMRKAWLDLDDNMKSHINEIRALHKYQSRRNASRVPKRSKEEEKDTPDVIHPVVRTHPTTGQKALYINPNIIDHLLGYEESIGDKLLDELIKFCTQDKFLYRHHWEAGDVLIWDNQCTMHRVKNDFNNLPREMMRILIEGSKPF